MSIYIEKGHATYYSNKSRDKPSKPKEFTIKSGYWNIIGGWKYNAFNFLFGNINEYYNFIYINNINDKEKRISKENLKNKIIQYINNKDLVSVSVFLIWKGKIKMVIIKHQVMLILF